MKVRFDSAKWSSRSGMAGQDYANGAANPRRSQSSAAIAAKDVYAAGVQAAIGQGRYEKGLAKAGDAKWSRGIIDKGRARYTQGVAVAGSNYSAGFQPFANALQGLELGPRGPKGQNYDRVQKVGELLRATKATV